MNTNPRRPFARATAAAILVLAGCGTTPIGTGTASPPATSATAPAGTSTPSLPASPSPSSTVEVTVTPAAATAAGNEADARTAGETAARALVALNSFGDVCGGKAGTKKVTIEELPVMAEWLTPKAVDWVRDDALPRWTEHADQDAGKALWDLVLVTADGTGHCTGVTPATVTGPVTVDSPDGTSIQATVTTHQELLSTRKADGQKMRGPADRTVTLTMARNTASAGHPWLVDDWTGTFQFGTAVPA